MYGILRNHLIRVALTLRRLGYITTPRDRAGGIALARCPEDISLGEIVRQTEDDLALLTCIQQEVGARAISPACRLKDVVSKVLGTSVGFRRLYLSRYCGKADRTAEMLEYTSFRECGVGRGVNDHEAYVF